jgi:hypothetical protein
MHFLHFQIHDVLTYCKLLHEQSPLLISFLPICEHLEDVTRYLLVSLVVKVFPLHRR